MFGKKRRGWTFCGTGRNMKRDNIILIGYMGCGKTTMGKCLAKLLDYTFTDTDELIEQQQNRTISEIFATDGEQGFRDMETAILKQLLDKKSDRLVISTGGGMPMREENRALLQKLGTVVYLRATPETIYERIKYDTSRPLLQCENPLKRIKEMLAQRADAYEAAAELNFDADEMSQMELANTIADSIKKS